MLIRSLGMGQGRSMARFAGYTTVVRRPLGFKNVIMAIGTHLGSGISRFQSGDLAGVVGSIMAEVTETVGDQKHSSGYQAADDSHDHDHQGHHLLRKFGHIYSVLFLCLESVKLGAMIKTT